MGKELLKLIKPSFSDERLVNQLNDQVVVKKIKQAEISYRPAYHLKEILYKSTVPKVLHHLIEKRWMEYCAVHEELYRNPESLLYQNSKILSYNMVIRKILEEIGYAGELVEQFPELKSEKHREDFNEKWKEIKNHYQLIFNQDRNLS